MKIDRNEKETEKRERKCKWDMRMCFRQADKQRQTGETDR